MVANKRAVRVNQEWAGHSGRVVRTSNVTFRATVHHGAENVPDPVPHSFPTWQVAAKPLLSGEVAVLFMNLDSGALAGNVSVALSDVGFVPNRHQDHYCAVDAWTGGGVDPWLGGS